jgi:hypothetical protein
MADGAAASFSSALRSICPKKNQRCQQPQAERRPGETSQPTPARQGSRIGLSECSRS